MLFKVIDHVICALVGDFADVEPSRRGIDHCHTSEGKVRTLLLVSPLIGANEVDTQRVPGNRLGFSGRYESVLLLSPLETFADVASLASLDNTRSQPNEGEMLAHG